MNRKFGTSLHKIRNTKGRLDDINVRSVNRGNVVSLLNGKRGLSLHGIIQKWHIDDIGVGRANFGDVVSLLNCKVEISLHGTMQTKATC